MEKEYGWALITDGKYKGHLGVYDDDEGDRAVVYLYKNPGTYVLVDIDYIQNVECQLPTIKTMVGG